MRTYFFILILVSLAGLSACYKDEGNYDYHELNKITITGIADNYSIQQGDSLRIFPTLEFSLDQSGDTAKYKYEWAALSGNTRRLLDTTLNYNKRFPLSSGTWDVYYTVTEKSTGLISRKHFKVAIIRSFVSGWLALCDVNGVARLDMVWVKDTPRVVNDLLAAASAGYTLTGKPNDVYANTYLGAASLFVATSTTTERFDPSSYVWRKGFDIRNEMLTDEPVGFTAQQMYMRTSGYTFMQANDGNLYYCHAQSGIYFGLAANVMSGEAFPFKMAPWFALVPDGATAYPMILYDETKRKFVRFTLGGANAAEMPTGTLFNFTTGKDLVYMESSRYNTGSIYAVLKDPGAANYYLARFVATRTITQNQFTPIAGADIEHATTFAVSPRYGYLFYAAGGKLHEYDIFSNTSKLMLDFGTKKINHIRFHNYVAGTNTALREDLVVCVNDPGLPDETSGTISTYTVPGANGELVLKNSYSGLGKIKTITYKE
ncbi:PKD-like family lipoprotein [Chitinophaga sedimenti]|uniref:PKD-like family lipoprotein n=1 Tax=Chitinophaga sedimenti TaxID=2033606 RepID=UPI0020037884|nr:PKD-like family lipoprotein [Chitinophaga sedimenti]MCK7554826.1 PKD-like family lipoprotein [Chitinophaga sedimenti]